MANINTAITLIRRKREEVDHEGHGNFRRYKGEYEELLRAINGLAGDPGFETLKTWMVSFVETKHRLPTPREVRMEARGICREHDVDIPSDSPLWGQ